MAKTQLAASLICAQMMNLEQEIQQLNEAKIDWIHFDVMDGVFVPRYGLHPEILEQLKKLTDIPVDVHLMVTNPDPYLEVFAKAGADMITVHAETCPNLHWTLKSIKNLGVKAGVVLNPATPLSTLDYVLEEIDCVVLMAINPGILGHKLIPSMMGKIKDLQKKLKKYPEMLVEIDGGVSFESGPLMAKAGANLLVCGTSSIYREEPLPVRVKKFRKLLSAK